MKQPHYRSIRSPLSNVSPSARQHSLRVRVVLLLLLLPPFAHVTSAWGAPYHGQVVDAETGRPIEAAVVLVEWHKKPRIAMGGITYFHNARETLTDAEGKFSLDSSPGIDWNPFTYIQEPRIIAFYPGYRPFTPAYPEDIGIKGGLNEIADAFERGVVVKLAKLTTEKESRRFTDSSGFGLIFAPYEVIPHFYRSINGQRKLVGMKELQYP